VQTKSAQFVEPGIAGTSRPVSSADAVPGRQEGVRKSASNMLNLAYGHSQRFRARHNDINILGSCSAESPAIRSIYRLNGGPERTFYIEPPAGSTSGTYPYGATTAGVNRLRGQPGYFNIEIPTGATELKAGCNHVVVAVTVLNGRREELTLDFEWQPDPVPLPLDLTDLSQVSSIQEIGQVVDGTFALDPTSGVICSVAPVAADSLLLLGSAYGSQEASYDVTFSNCGSSFCFMGLSDFFSGHEAQSPELGIKPGYSTGGLATLDNKGRARIWLAWGDCLMEINETWVVKTEKLARFVVEPDVPYRVRHQMILQGDVNCSRFRIWRKGDEEPSKWLCEENTLHLDPAHRPIHKASFGLFQCWGGPTSWSNITVRHLDVDSESICLTPRRRELLTRGWSKLADLAWKAKNRLTRAVCLESVRALSMPVGGKRASLVIPVVQPQ